MQITITPARKIEGRVVLPSDKSITHRLAMMAAIAEGRTVIANFASSQDCQSTLDCLRRLRVPIEVKDTTLFITGRGLRGLTAPETVLNAENSGSTIRMLSGILSGQKFLARISGDASLRRRPMKRIIEPLTQMGARISAEQGNYPPLTIQGDDLSPIRYSMPVASAQVKSAILLAGLYAAGKTEVEEPGPTRNHTELALREFGCDLVSEGSKVTVTGGSRLHGIQASVPGDISSAAFFMVAASCLPGSEILFEAVGLNPGRRVIVNLLQQMGGNVEVLDERVESGELVGCLRIRASLLRGGKICGNQIPQLIDEIPILAVLATQTSEGLEVRDAAELRVKESDRIRSIVENLRAMGASVDEFQDGMFIPGKQVLHNALINSYNDHRIAMAFAIAGLLARGETRIQGAESAAVSFPGFFEALEKVCVR